MEFLDRIEERERLTRFLALREGARRAVVGRGA